MQSIFNNSLYRETWLAASSKSVQSNPNDLLVLRLHLALSEMARLFSHGSLIQNPIEQRKQIFNEFFEVAKAGNSNAQFFLGLALMSGFGCDKKDVRMGTNLIYTASYLGSVLATRFIHLKTGQAYLYGDNVKQDVWQAIQSFKLAGKIAKLEREIIKVYLVDQRKILQERAKITSTQKLALVMNS